ncbi:MAG: valine--tRNA ligase [Bacteroidota bacterium]
MSTKKTYESQAVEAKWYDYWLEKNYFHSEPDEREPFTIVIPPPNVTGVLHMGHMLNNTIQDILIRKARLEGKNACWVPGTDHASIATEAKVVKKLREEGIKKADLTRDEFMTYAFEWKDKYGGIILEQLKKLGASCDWERTRFTMDDEMYKAVIKVFVELYKKGKLYRGLRMTNWDPEAQTVLSNEEVLYSDENSNLYHVRYKVVGTEDEYITIATQRPETIMADTGLAVNPKDERYTKYHGKRVIVPLVQREIPIIVDDYVELDFGTGALKVTPAHDPNDYDLGQKYGLEVIDTINLDGTMNELAQYAVGLDRFEARTEIVKMLKASGDLVDITQYRTRVGRSERTDAVVEPKLTLQWFMKMDELSATALEAVRSGEVKFHPEQMFNMYKSWLTPDNVRDWCISRQLWWGQRIPAWYYGEEVFVAETAAEALAQAREKLGNPDLSLSDLQQDEDVLDTWASSWLWPMSVFDGFRDQEELAYYYPTNDLVTGWDIMYLWVARMIMAGYEFSGDLLGEDFVKANGRMPFRNVYFTGMVRDEKRRKMSKSLGNSPDAIQLLDKYGADGVRFGMLSSAAAGNDIIFDAPIDPKTGSVKNESKLCDQGRKFCNKIFNANRLIQGWEVAADRPVPANESLAAGWLESRLNQVIRETDRLMSEYRISEAMMGLYKFIWGDFCSWYLEVIKPVDGKLSQSTYDRTITAFERMMTLLHPFMPFITEEVWHDLRHREDEEDCIVSQWPSAGEEDASLLNEFERLQQLIGSVREVRNSRGIKAREPLACFLQRSEQSAAMLSRPGWAEVVKKLAYLESLTLTDEEPSNAVTFLTGNDTTYLITNETIDVEAEKAKIEGELKRLRGQLIGVEKKLANERFVSNAPENVVAHERKKLVDFKAKIESLEGQIVKL